MKQPTSSPVSQTFSSSQHNNISTWSQKARLWVCWGLLGGMLLCFLPPPQQAEAAPLTSREIDLELRKLGIQWTPLKPFALRLGADKIKFTWKTTETPAIQVYVQALGGVLREVYTVMRTVDFLLRVTGQKKDPTAAAIQHMERNLTSQMKTLFQDRSYEDALQAFQRANNCLRSRDYACAMRETNKAWVAAKRGSKRYARGDLHRWSAIMMKIGLYWRLQIKRHREHPMVKRWQTMLPLLDKALQKLGKRWQKAPMAFKAQMSGIPLFRKCVYSFETPFLVVQKAARSVDYASCTQRLKKDLTLAQLYRERVMFRIARAIEKKTNTWSKAYTQHTCQRLHRSYSNMLPDKPRKCGLWKACADGSGAACSYTGLLYFDQGLRKEAFRYFHKGCRKKSSLGCMGLGYFYKEGLGIVKPSPLQARAHYRRACALKDGIGCRLLADQLQQATAKHSPKQQAKHKKTTHALYATACKMDDANACHTRADLAGFPLSRSLPFYRRACKLWHGPACLKAGLVEYIHGSLAKARDSLQRSCSKNTPQACALAQKLSRPTPPCVQYQGIELCR